MEVERMLDDLRFGKVLALIANLFAKGSAEPRDFFPNLPEIRRREQTVEEQIEVMKANTVILRALG